MRYVLAFIFLVISVPALADNESWKRQEVPDPIPPGFNECVIIVPTDKAHANGVTIKVGEMRPPLTREDHAYLAYWRREGWAILQLCHQRGT